jgi:prepilin-type N-terminal cleavage/methylation domain-containing protein
VKSVLPNRNGIILKNPVAGSLKAAYQVPAVEVSSARAAVRCVRPAFPVDCEDLLNPPSLKDNGFTLVELAIVLVLVGILVSLGAGMIGPLTKRAKMNETKDTVNAAVDSVLGYGAINNPNRLPDLSASPSATSFWTNVRTQNDAWGRQLVYVYDNTLATSICNRTSTNITLRICNDAACGTYSTINNVAFLVLSAGDNANNQTIGSQAVNAAATVLTYQTGIKVDNYPGDFTRATDEYDDIVKWITLAELQVKMACQRCTAYEVWNNLGVTGYFRVNGIGCTQITNATLISSVGPGGAINGFADASCTSATTPPALTYTSAVIIDTNKNCAVNFTGTDR